VLHTRVLEIESTNEEMNHTSKVKIRNNKQNNSLTTTRKSVLVNIIGGINRRGRKLEVI
jgi:hypothetical protein